MSIRVSELSKLCGNSKRKQQASTPAINLGYPSAEQVCISSIIHAIMKISSDIYRSVSRKRFEILSTDLCKSRHRVRWEDGNKDACTRMGFNGVPFIILDSKILDCQHGVDRHNYRKTKAQSDAVSLYCRKHCYISSYDPAGFVSRFKAKNIRSWPSW